MLNQARDSDEKKNKTENTTLASLGSLIWHMEREWFHIIKLIT